MPLGEKCDERREGRSAVQQEREGQSEHNQDAAEIPQQLSGTIGQRPRVRVAQEQPQSAVDAQPRQHTRGREPPRGAPAEGQQLRQANARHRHGGQQPNQRILRLPLPGAALLDSLHYCPLLSQPRILPRERILFSALPSHVRQRCCQSG